MARKSGGVAVVSPKSCPEGHKSVAGGGSETERNGNAEGARVSEGPRGASNTPDLAYFNTSIDYLKVRFNRLFGDNDLEFERLFEILRIDIHEFQEKPGGDNYEQTYQFDEGLVVMWGGNKTNAKGGQSTCCFEMKGNACRLFEERLWHELYFDLEPSVAKKVATEGWKKLLHQIDVMCGVCTRVDLPTDDLGGFIQFDQLHAKILNKEYCTNMRRFALQDDLPKNVDAARLIDSKHSGFSATWGSKDSVQLCIYNKLAERKVHGGTFNVDFWIRYEVRYFHKNAERAFAFLLTAFDAGNVPEFIVGCLAGMIEFKQEVDGFRKSRNLCHAPIWERWTGFLQGAKEQKVSMRVRGKGTYCSAAEWLDKSCSRALARLVAGRLDDATALLNFLLYDGTSKFDEEDLFAVNNYRQSIDLEPFGDLVGMINAVRKVPGVSKYPKKEIADLLCGTDIDLGGAKYTKIDSDAPDTIHLDMDDE